MDLELENYELSGEKVKIVSLDIEWSSNVGFGHLLIYYDEKIKKWKVDTECMGEDFVEALFEFCNKKIKSNFIVDD